MPRSSLTPALRERYTSEYLETLDRIDNLRTELKEEVKERKGEIASLEKAAFRLRRLLGGREEEQTTIPGAEIPQVKPRRDVESVTLEAHGSSVTLDGKARENVEAKIREEAGRGAKRRAR